MTERHSAKAASDYVTAPAPLRPRRAAMANRRTLQLTSILTKAVARKKGIRLTESERQIILAELADIRAELDELCARADEIVTRLDRPSSAQLAG